MVKKKETMMVKMMGKHLAKKMDLLKQRDSVMERRRDWQTDC